jgi:hypothetical protein
MSLKRALLLFIATLGLVAVAAPMEAQPYHHYHHRHCYWHHGHRHCRYY